jgi:CubicO group peptidase (beta-lactamase class C family)
MFSLLRAGAVEVWPMPEWQRSEPAAQQIDAAKLVQARDYALTGEGSGYITRHGYLVMSWGNPRVRYDLKSSTKSFGSIALGLAIGDGKLKLSDKARLHHPTLGTPPDTNAANGWLDEIALLHLASQTAGFEKPGGFTRLLFRPGTQWDYSDSGPNWLAECITLAYRRDLNELMFERVFTPLGIKPGDVTWRRNSYRPALIDGVARREFGAGISANVDAMARVGYLMLRGGRWGDRQIIPRDYVESSPKTPVGHASLNVLNPKDYGNASRHYGLLWWNNNDGKLDGVPRDAYWSWGLYDSMILVVPSLDIVAARAGKSWKRRQEADHYDVLKPFFVPIVNSVQRKDATAIQRIDWAPTNTIIRLARGSDNWPATWGDDDHLYTAYGDGNGFEPFLPEKLSVGLARVRGIPQNIAGENIRSSIEQKGDGERGLKASGLLMIDGTLYVWLRNAGNAQLGWSDDRGTNWTFANWKLTNSFGCPTFLNFGPNYAGARDEFVYIYSHDQDSAYQPADQMVLSRVPRDKLQERNAYEFFTGVKDNNAEWSRNIADRAPVYANPGKCYRSGVSYNAGLKRYFWVQVFPQSRHAQGPRFQGGFAVTEAAEPWGPWRTIFETNDWDTGPGETASFPTKWMSADGTRMHLLFSGNDHFSVRSCTVVVPSGAKSGGK